MPIPALILWADSTKGELVAGWQVNSTLGPLVLRKGDTVGVELHWVKRGLSTLMNEVEWPSMGNITLAVGRVDSAPTSGTFKLSYGSEQTSSLSYAATAADLQTALNALTGITSEGGVTVSKSGTTYRINWNTAGVPAHSITLYSNDLTPSSTVGIGIARAGSVSVAQVVQMHIKQAPFARCTEWVNQDPPEITVTETHIPTYSGDYRVWRVVIAPQPKQGTFRLSKTINSVTTWTAPISVSGLTANAIALALDMSVTQISDYEFEISQSQISLDVENNVSAITGDGTGLVGFSSKYGLLSLNTLDAELFLAGQAQGSALAEIEVEFDGKRQTLVQNNCTIFNDIIDTDGYTIIQYGDLYPAASVVRWDSPQTISGAGQTQARANIGALGLSDLSSINLSITDLGNRVTVLEGLELTADQRAAITSASSPTALNPFSTLSDLAGKANLVHSHAIGDVTGLSTALSGKAAVTHTHAIADVSGLQDALDTLTANKADVGHTHTLSEVVGLVAALAGKSDISHTHATLPTSNEKDALDAAASPSASNPFITKSKLEGDAFSVGANASGFSTAGFDTVHYPSEIAIKVGGTTYYVPARY